MIIGTVKGSARNGTDSFSLDDTVLAEDLYLSSNEIQDLVGDGNAKVSVGLGMSNKDYGNGYDVHVTVTLSCSQNREIVGYAYDAASDLASSICRDAYNKMTALYGEASSE